MASPQVTDRALRYRAQKNAPEGPRICSYCGSERSVEVEHIDGHEENTESENLTWACRSCNTAKGVAMRNAGLGRRTRQFNPAVKGATTIGEWVQAVGAISPHKGKQYAGRRYGLVSDMPVSEAVAIIRATSPSKRSEFAEKLKRGRRNSLTSAAKETGRAALKHADRIGRAVGSVASLPRKWAGSLVGEKGNPSDRAEMTFDKTAGDYIVFGVAVPGGSQHFKKVGDAETAMLEYRSSAPVLGNPSDQSVQDKSYREWAENYQRVQAAPEKASEKDLRRALGFLDRKRMATIRRYQDQGRPVDPQVIAGYDNDYEYFRSLILKREKQSGRNGSKRNPSELEAIADKYLQKVVDKYGIDNVRVQIKNTFPAYVQRFTDGSIKMAVPNPTTPGRLNTFLHECCHALLDHGQGEASSEAEYEAVTCAKETMDREGMPHAKDEEEYDVGSVIGAIIEDIRSGSDVDSRAVRMVQSYNERNGQEPNAAFQRVLDQYERKHGHALL